MREVAAGARSSKGRRRLWGPFYRDPEHTDKPMAPKNPARQQLRDKGGSCPFRREVGDALDRWAPTSIDCERGNGEGCWASRCWAGPRGKACAWPTGKEGAEALGQELGRQAEMEGREGKERKKLLLFF